MDIVINSINKTSKISRKTEAELKSCLRLIQLPKRAILIDPNKRDDNIYFVEKGIARAYTIADGKEMTSWFSKEGDLLY